MVKKILSLCYLPARPWAQQQLDFRTEGVESPHRPHAGDGRTALRRSKGRWPSPLPGSLLSKPQGLFRGGGGGGRGQLHGERAREGEGGREQLVPFLFRIFFHEQQQQQQRWCLPLPVVVVLVVLATAFEGQ